MPFAVRRRRHAARTAELDVVRRPGLLVWRQQRPTAFEAGAHVTAVFMPRRNRTRPISRLSPVDAPSWASSYYVTVSDTNVNRTVTPFSLSPRGRGRFASAC